MRYFKNKNTGEVYGYDPDQEDLINSAESNPDMEDVTSSWPPPEFSTITKEDEVRAERNFLLMQSDWTQVLDAPVDQAAWANYRQQLRDLPQQAGFPDNVTWPTKPE